MQNKKRIEEKQREQRISDYKKRQAFNVLDTTPKKFRFISFDVETSSRNNDFYLCGVIDEEGVYKTYWSEQEVIDYFDTLKDNDLMIVATNLDFDYSNIFKTNKSLNKCEFIVNNGRFIVITMTTKYGKVRFYDSLNYGGFSVETMGKILGKPKLKHPKCLGKIPKNKKEKEELVTYNKRDCEVTRDFMVMLQDAMNLEGGELKATVSSCALDIYRRRFMPFSMTREEIETGLIGVKKKVHLAYYGGRTEAFSRGKIEKYNYYDVNSLYPTMMLKNYPVPQSMNYFIGEDRKLLKFMGVSFFKLDIPYSKYPLLPYRFEDRLTFPYGKIMGYYTHEEINRAVELYGKDIIKEMRDTVFYTETFPVFKKFVEYMYNRRLEEKTKKSPFEVFYKLLMNSLYGKFAMKNIANTNFFIPETEEDVVYAIEKAGDGANLSIHLGTASYYTTSKEYDGVFSFPILSCYVTAYARVHIHKFIEESDAVYCDTDSIFTKNKIETSNLLGDMKLEDTINTGIVIKPKSYFVNDKIKFKGLRIPKDYKHINRLKQNILKGHPIHYEKFVKIKEGIKRQMNINSITIVAKNVDLEDKKRDWKGKTFNPNELQDSEPLKMDEW